LTRCKLQYSYHNLICLGNLVDATFPEQKDNIIMGPSLLIVLGIWHLVSP